MDSSVTWQQFFKIYIACLCIGFWKEAILSCLKGRVCLAQTLIRSSRRDRRFSPQLEQHRIWLVADSKNEVPIPIKVLFNVALISDARATINRDYIFVPTECYFIVRFQFQKFYASLCWSFEILVACAGRQSNFRGEFFSLAAISSVSSSASTQCLDSINDPAGMFPLLFLHHCFWHRHSVFPCAQCGWHSRAGRLDTVSQNVSVQ